MAEKNIGHTKWMKRAIFLASLGKNTTSPNPKVGAVILDKDGNLISEGFHYKAGMPHAEAMAFNNLKKDAKGGSMYVNLEPCCHHGKTPPCVDKVISSGIIKVYISIEDPDKRVAGKGIKLLKEAGIQVHLGLCKKESLELNKDFISIVFHDAYQYFEKRFGINILGAFTVNTDVLPGAEQLSEIREVIEHEKVSCVFSEPQFNPDIINTVAKDMDIKTGVLDPLGATLDPGKGLYFKLIKNISK